MSLPGISFPTASFFPPMFMIIGQDQRRSVSGESQLELTTIGQSRNNIRGRDVRPRLRGKWKPLYLSTIPVLQSSRNYLDYLGLSHGR